jgi:imidazolonepropionase-like amidohydrolase
VPAIVERAGLTQKILQDGVAGSDAGPGPAKPHGILPRTLEKYVVSGPKPTAAPKAATVDAAEARRVADRTARIRPGFDADLLPAAAPHAPGTGGGAVTVSQGRAARPRNRRWP